MIIWTLAVYPEPDLIVPGSPPDVESGKSSAEPCRGGQTTQKAKIYLGDFWTSQSEQFLKLSLMKHQWEVSSEAQISPRSSGYSSPHLAPRTASRQPKQISLSLSLSLSLSPE